MKCRDKNGEQNNQYGAFFPWIIVASAVVALGLPFMFYFLVRRFMHHGRRGDRVVQAALGWMCASIKNRAL